MISVKDIPYGAIGDGVTDDTSAIQAAIRAAEALGGGHVFFPRGAYRITGNLTVLGQYVTLVGEHRKSAVLFIDHPSNDLLTLIGWDNNIRSLGFDSVGVRTAGTHVNLYGVRSIIEDFYVNGDYIGIHMTGTSSKILNGVMTTGKAEGTRILVDGGDTSQLIDGVTIGAQDGPKPAFGIRVVNSAALIIDNTNVLTAGICLALLPGPGQGVHSLYASNCFFDSSGTGIMAVSSNDGHISRCRFIGCWTGGHTGNGVDLRKDGTGDCTGIHFVEHHSLNNGLSGFSIGTGVTDFSLNGGEVAGNDNGVWIAQAVTDFSIQNATIGYGGGMVANRHWGVFMNNYCNRYFITGNRMIYNPSGSCNVVTNQFGKVDNIG